MYLHRLCATCDRYNKKKCKGYQFNENLINVGLSCKNYKTKKEEK